LLASCNSFYNSALVAVEERGPSTHWIANWAGLLFDLYVVVCRNIGVSARSQTLAIQTVANRITDYLSLLINLASINWHASVK